MRFKLLGVPLLVTVVINNVYTYVIAIPKNVFAVSSLQGAEDVYLKRMVPESILPLEESFRSRLEVCKGALSSTFFSDNFNVEFIDPITEYAKKFIKDNNAVVYQNNYNEYRDSSGNIQIRYNNSYKSREISILEKRENITVFVCLAIKDLQKVPSIIEYFISKEYDLSYANNVTDDSDVGFWGHHEVRFVFAGKNSTMDLIAIVEEAANYHQFYSEHEQYEYLSEKYTIDHTLCNMTAIEKIRLCTILLAAEDFREKFCYGPSRDNIEPQCVDRNVTSYSKTNRNNFQSDPSTPYFLEHWLMLECRGRRIIQNSKSAYEPYYISRAPGLLGKYTFLVFHQHSNTTALIGYFDSLFLHCSFKTL